jgi:hypothetical protein
MRTEASLWGVALALGLSIGAWQAVTTSTPTAALGLSAVSAVNAEPAEANAVTHDHGAPKNAVVQIGSWLLERAIAFVRVAWWTLPIPLLFSIWRQVATRPVCAHCGSRRLIPGELAT